MREAGAVVAKDGSIIYWHVPDNRSGGALPDSQQLWQVLWENRKRLRGFAHSHPGGGIPGPSHEDLTTFAAIEAGLGVRLQWWIANADRVVELQWIGPDRLAYGQILLGPDDPDWAAELRRRSEIPVAT